MRHLVWSRTNYSKVIFIFIFFYYFDLSIYIFSIGKVAASYYCRSYIELVFVTNKNSWIYFIHYNIVKIIIISKHLLMLYDFYELQFLQFLRVTLYYHFYKWRPLKSRYAGTLTIRFLLFYQIDSTPKMTIKNLLTMQNYIFWNVPNRVT